MTLPFETPGGRKFQCFVCGQLFEDWLEYKSHIIDSHEEVREYVLCPLKRCGAPVRDLKLHFKVKHPTEDFKKVTGPTRALIWKDHGGKKTKKPKFRQGKHFSTKMQKYFTYRSGWEKTVFELLDLDKEVRGYDVEPFQVDYIHKGKTHKYTPDIFVTFEDGHNEVWEIKPQSQSASRKNKDKWFFAEEACKIRGWKFLPIMEQQINKLKKKVRDQNIELG
jgi:hypothetical protein